MRLGGGVHPARPQAIAEVGAKAHWRTGTAVAMCHFNSVQCVRLVVPSGWPPPRKPLAYLSCGMNRVAMDWMLVLMSAVTVCMKRWALKLGTWRSSVWAACLRALL
jgi:hypothetical protein